MFAIGLGMSDPCRFRGNRKFLVIMQSSNYKSLTVLSYRFGQECNELPVETQDFMQKEAMISSIKALETMRFRGRQPFENFHNAQF